MNGLRIAKDIIMRQGGIAKTADFTVAGLSRQRLAQLVHAGYLERVLHGYYRMPDTEDISEEQMLATFLPQAVVSVESALYHYGYTDFTPRVWSISVPRDMARSKLATSMLPLRVYYVHHALHALGKTMSDFQGVLLPVYDRERTICDCVKYQTKLDSEIFSKALKAYALDSDKNLAQLSLYAKQLRVYKKITELMEVLIHG